MTKRITTYLDEDTAELLSKFENKSKIVKEALNMHFLNRKYFIGRKKILERENKNLQYQINNNKIELKFIDGQLKIINKKRNERPQNYESAVCTLKSLYNVNEEDLRFQAERLNVDPTQFKAWLWVDGYYEEIFEK